MNGIELRNDAGPLFRVGVVVATHGLRGDLRVRPATAGSLALADARELTVLLPSGERCLRTARRVSPHGASLLLALEGCSHIDQAQAYVGAELYMAQADLATPEDGSLYWHQLEGLRVIDRRLGVVGTLESLLETPGHDLYVVQGPYGEVLLPAVAAMIEAIDLEAGEMRVNLPEGLIGLNG
ncbi:ribosome maturation factor RimM [Desulfuromonas thiophila]|uniref:ribosome maturation factor RimM n=1 Tax=Desulfuromonas thiophila TaxID=57664 RepID=UPI0024A7A6C4|nr:ribosome maturation factor RimM [Desulfuromonas thiophila]